jgi:hypothetical protein
MLVGRSGEQIRDYLPIISGDGSSELKKASSFEVMEVSGVINEFQEVETALRLIQQLFLYRKECGLRTSAYHQDCLLVRKTSTVIDVHLDLAKHQSTNSLGNKVFQAEYLDGCWQVSCCRKGIWIRQLAIVVKGYQSQCFGSIDDSKYFPLTSRL